MENNDMTKKELIEYENKKKNNMIDVKIYAHKTHIDAVIPQVAYSGTSAAFDLVCVEDTRVLPHSSAVVPNGLNLTIDQKDKFFMYLQLRSSMGFKKELGLHSGIVDPGYTGSTDVKLYNFSENDIWIKKGERYAQVVVLPIPNYVIEELNDEQFEELKQKQQRGDSGFGSSGK